MKQINDVSFKHSSYIITVHMYILYNYIYICLFNFLHSKDHLQIMTFSWSKKYVVSTFLDISKLWAADTFRSWDWPTCRISLAISKTWIGTQWAWLNQSDINWYYMILNDINWY
jgi:hypothetical protein